MSAGLGPRLNRLRVQSGASARACEEGPQSLDSASASLQQRLRRLAPRRVSRADGAPPVDAAGLARLLQGEPVADGVIEIRSEPVLSRYAPAGGGSADWHSAFPETDGLVEEDWVFMDTETTGLAGGTGTLVFLLGLARWEAGRLVARQYLCTRIAGEAHMLRLGLEWSAGAGLISYNGKSFDRPLLDTRCRMHGLAVDFRDRPHLDLLYTVRRAYENRWPDCRLQSAERRLLELRRDHDLPGSEAPDAWLAYLRAGDAGRLAGVVRHNRQDLASLAGLLDVLVQVYRRPDEWRADPLRIARAWSRLGRAERAIALLEVGEQAANARRELAELYRRRCDWPAARSIWEDLAAQGDARALECLAKYHEHVGRDLLAARRCAEALPDEARHRRRRRRIARKAGANLPLPLL